MRLTVITALSHSLDAIESFALGGAAQPSAASTTTCLAAVAVQMSAETVTWMSTGRPPRGWMVTQSPAAVDGVAFVMVQAALAPGGSLMHAVNGMPTPVAAGTSMVTTGVVQST